MATGSPAFFGRVQDELLPPGQETDESKLVGFVKQRAYRSSPLYADDFSMFRKAELYDQSEQWLRRAYTTRDSRYPTQWIKIDYDAGDPNSIPLPVYNEMVALRENESARLSRPEYKPRVKPKGENPGITEKEGAKGAERALQYRLKEMPWDQVEEQATYNMPMYGGTWLESRWEQSWMETIRVPANSVICSRNPQAAGGATPGEPIRGVDPNEPVPSQVPPPTAQPEPPQGAGMPPQGPGVPPGPGMSVPNAPPSPLGGQPGMQDTQMIAPAGGGLEGDWPADQSQMLEGQASVSEPGLEQLQTMMGGVGAPSQLPPCPYVDTAENAKKANVPTDGACPLCGSPLMSYQPTQEEALGPLGKDWPKGDWKVSTPWPYGIFPRDAGVGVDRSDVDEWVRVEIRPISWVEERYPHKVRSPTGELLIHPQHPTALMVENPTFGAPVVFQAGQHTAAFRNHVLVYEYNRKPWMAWNPELKKYTKNRGRHTVVVQERVCIDTDLEIESINQPGRWIPRVRLEFVHWEPKEGGRRSTVGQSLWDRLYDCQDGINERMAQVRAVNQRGALPWYIQQRGRNFESRAADASVPFRRVLCDIDPNDKQPPLTLMQNTTIDAGVYAEIDAGRDFAQRVSGQVEVERGQVPPGVAAATAIAYLKTESGEKRRPRIKRLRSALVRAWQHGADLMGGLYIEPREYSYEDEFTEERWAFIHGDIIASSNPKVDIYPTPDYDQDDLEREQIRDLITLGVLDPRQTPQLNRKIVQTLFPRGEFYGYDDHREEQSQREWRDFKEYGRVPVIDPSLDDAMTHFQEHGRECFSAWFRGEEAKAGWDRILGFLGSDWDEALTQLSFLKPPGTSLQDLILQFWNVRMQMAVQMQGYQPPMDEEGIKALENVLHWRSHMEAHKYEFLMQAAKQQPPPTAPGQGSSPTTASESPSGAGPAGAGGAAPMPQPGPEGAM
jgi:hypothetical protein